MPAIRFYADSADRQSVSALLADAVICGVTTNPTILAASSMTGEDIPGLYDEWAAAGAGEIFFQTWGSTTTTLVDTGKRLAALGERIVVKVPATSEGIPAAARLVRDGVPVLVTAVYSVAQAAAAASVGARYIAPYLGRLEDAGRAGVDDVCAMQRAVEGSQCDVLVASLRSPAAIATLAELGLRYFTAAPSVLRACFVTPSSDASAVAFDAASTGWTLA